jgi:hypothetical protein
MHAVFRTLVAPTQTIFTVLFKIRAKNVKGEVVLIFVFLLRGLLIFSFFLFFFLKKFKYG